MGYYPPNTRVSTSPLVPVMNQQQKFLAALSRQSPPPSIDRDDAYVMWRLVYARKKAKNRADWVQRRKIILKTVDLVRVHTPGPAVLRWAK